MLPFRGLFACSLGVHCSFSLETLVVWSISSSLGFSSKSRVVILLFLNSLLTVLWFCFFFLSSLFEVPSLLSAQVSLICNSPPPPCVMSLPHLCHFLYPMLHVMGHDNTSEWHTNITREENNHSSLISHNTYVLQIPLCVKRKLCVFYYCELQVPLKLPP